MSVNDEKLLAGGLQPSANPQVMVAVATQFELRRWTLYPRMFKLTYLIAAQARRSKGLIHMSISPISLRTLTVWSSMEAMIAFRNSGAHGKAMDVTWQLGRNNSVTWSAEYIPSNKEARDRLAASRRVKKRART